MAVYLKYNDPIRILWRQGNVVDPYVDVLDPNLPVINNRVVFSEIPDSFSHVIIDGFTEIYPNPYGELTLPEAGQFLVDYQRGMGYFNSSDEGKKLNAVYKGRGMIQYPAERIYVHGENPDVIETLQDFIERAQAKIDEMTAKIEEANEAIAEAKEATKNANDAHDSTIMVYKGTVGTFDEIATSYPNPELGWVVMIESTGERYRYDTETDTWVFIDNYTPSIPLASDTVDGLLAKEDYSKLQRQADTNTRTMVFMLPYIDFVGPQDMLVQFPHSGRITNVTSFCNRPNIAHRVEISIEKVSEADFVNGYWASISIDDILFPVGSVIGEDPTLGNDEVVAGDMFRLNVTNTGSDYLIKGITVQIEVTL